MAAHRLRMTVPGFDIGGSNVVFVVQSNRRTPSGDLEKLGELHISKGSLEWWPKGPSATAERWPGRSSRTGSRSTVAASEGAVTANDRRPR